MPAAKSPDRARLCPGRLCRQPRYAQDVRQALQPGRQLKRKQGQEIVSIAIGAAAKDCAAGYAAAGLAREYKRVAADFGAGAQLFDHAAKYGLLGRRQDLHGQFAQQAGLAPANVLRAAFHPGDDEILVEKENEIEGAEEWRWGGFCVRARAVLPWGRRGRSLWRGIGATLFFLGQPPDRPADSLEGAQFLGGELAGGRSGFAGHLPRLELRPCLRIRRRRFVIHQAVQQE